MERIRFQVQGSSPDPYEVTFVNRGNGNLSAYCTCKAGENGLYCKHRFGILRGEATNVVNADPSQIAQVESWLPGSDVEAAIDDLREAEDDYAAAKRAVSAAKKRVAQAMRD